jgi:DNA-binding NtrC family response regulator
MPLIYLSNLRKGDEPMPLLTKNSKPTRVYAAIAQPVGITEPLSDVKVLLLTPSLEVRQSILRTLDSLSADTINCSTYQQAAELLAAKEFDVIFCDEHLVDGSYRDLIHANNYAARTPRIIVTTRTGEWDLYFKALGDGAFDIIRAPWHSTDIEMILIRALREQEHPAASGATA